MNFPTIFLTSMLLLTTALALNSCGKPEDLEDSLEDGSFFPYPNFKGSEFRGEKNFKTLINSYAEGKSEPTPWAGYWWPYTANGIASGTYGGGGSPAGKYDAARGGRVSAQSWEVRNHGTSTPKIQSWFGHCNGWCVAAALFPEPKEPVTVNGVTFTVADIKALLSEAGMEASADFYGDRVDWGQDYDSGKYSDTVPDQYFLVLTNYIGRLKQAVLIDRYTGDQIWNQPLAGYRFEYPKPADYLGADPSAPNVYRIMVTSTIWWLRDDVPPGVITAPFNWEESDHVQARTLQMEVWLDGPVVFGADGKIQSSGDVIVTRSGEHFVGGTWRMGEGILVDAWPDYMWVPYSVIKPTDYANPEVDVEWLRKHILTPGGADDNTASPRPIDPAPRPNPSGWPNPFPTDGPRPRPTDTDPPSPFPTSTPRPRPTDNDPPNPFPTDSPFPFPFPRFP